MKVWCFADLQHVCRLRNVEEGLGMVEHNYPSNSVLPASMTDTALGAFSCAGRFDEKTALVRS